jgi:hypothetical protein
VCTVDGTAPFFQTRQGLEFLRKRRELKVEDLKKILCNCARNPIIFEN